MVPPIFNVCAADPAVTALLGTGPVRLFPFGEAPQGTVYPYATWQVITGSPENYLAGRPDADGYTLQVDVYAGTGSDARAVTRSLRDAIEPHAYITRWGGEERDTETKAYCRSFDIDWIILR
ncbi:DUF3168 domain-containing protein [Oceanisphaera sediminis]|uniref:DUF3168 domain-containing protein n=1 Tax=Oceanisphaera sediminis TaxID=981381 RepID=A0ABP7ES41_9GAMM